MSQYSAVPAVISHLTEIPELTYAEIVEDFTSPSVKRPVLHPIVSVGVKEMKMEPITRYRHRISVVMRLTMLFPCGLGDSDISETVYKVSASFVGRVFHYLLVESVTVNGTEFNSQMYGVKVELDLNMKATENGSDPLETRSESFSVGSVGLDRMPDSITESRAAKSDSPIEDSPREITVEGTSSAMATGGSWDALHSLIGSGEEFDFVMPRTERTVRVKGKSIETGGDLCGYGFSYKIVLEEVL